jgi:hypothetical protein
MTSDRTEGGRTALTTGGHPQMRAEAVPDHAAEAGDLRHFTIVFTTQTCDACGETTHVSVACGCGETEARSDSHVERRRELLQAVPAWPAVGEVPPVELADAIAVLDGWIEALFEALDDFGSGVRGADLLVEHIEALRRLRAQIDCVELLRPWIALWRPLTTVVDRLLDMASQYVDALLAADPATAQEKETASQAALDAAAEAVHVLAQRLDRWQLPGTVRLPDFLITRAEAAYDLTGAANLLDLDARGQPLYERITGRRRPPAGIGVGLLLDVGHVQDAFDEERFWRISGTAYNRLDRSRDVFRALMDDPAWRGHIQAARASFYDGLLKAEALLESLSGDRRMEVDAVLELGANLTENVGSSVLRLLLGVRAKRPDRLLRLKDYTSILQQAAQVGLGDLLLGFDPDIRNADAHKDYQILDGAVTLSGDRPRTVRDEALADAVLAALESSAALFAALDCVLAEEGRTEVHHRLAALPPQDFLTIICAANGIADCTVGLRRDRLDVRGRTLASVVVRPLTIIASLAPYVPEAAASVRVSLRTPTGNVNARGPLTPFRRFANLEGLAKEAAFVELIARWTIGGRPVASTAHVRYWAAFRAGDVIQVDLEQAEAILDVLSLLARRLHDIPLLEALEGMGAAKRASVTGIAAPVIVRDRMLRLNGWLLARPGPINDGGPTGPAPPTGMATA